MMFHNDRKLIVMNSVMYWILWEKHLRDTLFAGGFAWLSVHSHLMIDQPLAGEEGTPRNQFKKAFDRL